MRIGELSTWGCSQDQSTGRPSGRGTERANRTISHSLVERSRTNSPVQSSSRCAMASTSGRCRARCRDNLRAFSELVSERRCQPDRAGRRPRAEQQYLRVAGLSLAVCSHEQSPEQLSAPTRACVHPRRASAALIRLVQPPPGNCPSTNLLDWPRNQPRVVDDVSAEGGGTVACPVCHI